MNRPVSARWSRVRSERRSHGGTVQRTRGWCVARPHTGQVGKLLAELCMERDVMTARQGRTQPGAKCTAGPYTQREAKPMAGHCKGQLGGAWRGLTRNTSASAWRSCAWTESLLLRGWAVDRPGATYTAGPYTELEGTLTAGPCTERAGRSVAGQCTKRAENLGPCNGQEGSVRRGRTWNRPASARWSRARNERRSTRPGRAKDNKVVRGGGAYGTGRKAPG